MPGNINTYLLVFVYVWYMYWAFFQVFVLQFPPFFFVFKTNISDLDKLRDKHKSHCQNSQTSLFFLSRQHNSQPSLFFLSRRLCRFSSPVASGTSKMVGMSVTNCVLTFYLSVSFYKNVSIFSFVQSARHVRVQASKITILVFNTIEEIFHCKTWQVVVGLRLRIL